MRSIYKKVPLKNTLYFRKYKKEKLLTKTYTIIATKKNNNRDTSVYETQDYFSPNAHRESGFSSEHRHTRH
jgi:hypothetical protein